MIDCFVDPTFPYFQKMSSKSSLDITHSTNNNTPLPNVNKNDTNSNNNDKKNNNENNLKVFENTMYDSDNDNDGLVQLEAYDNYKSNPKNVNTYNLTLQQQQKQQTQPNTQQTTQHTKQSSVIVKGSQKQRPNHCSKLSSKTMTATTATTVTGHGRSPSPNSSNLADSPSITTPIISGGSAKHTPHFQFNHVLNKDKSKNHSLEIQQQQQHQQQPQQQQQQSSQNNDITSTKQEKEQIAAILSMSSVFSLLFLVLFLVLVFVFAFVSNTALMFL